MYRKNILSLVLTFPPHKLLPNSILQNKRRENTESTTLTESVVDENATYEDTGMSVALHVTILVQ